MSVKYQVERRPMSASGKVYRGTGHGDYVLTLTRPEKNPNGSQIALSAAGGQNIVAHCYYIPAGVEPKDFPKYVVQSGTYSAEALSHVQEVNGEPWLVHSTHFSIDSALESAAPLAAAIGSENVRIIKVLSHTMEFKLK
jgi:hypothetical protein